jgi:prepilin-type N-terminal cleavage/methylation domain-containing protein
MNGFTITELLVTLALTSIAITFAYGTLSYVQNLFFNFKKQNQFINEYIDFKNRMDYEALYSDFIVEAKENHFEIRRDSSIIDLAFLEKVILLKKNNHCDTFHIKARKPKKEFEMMKNPVYNNKLVKSISFEFEFTKQKFNFYFYKNYDASIKLQLDRQELGRN